MEHIGDILVFLAGFVVIALAAKQIGEFFVGLKLPAISGFLFTGIIAGPFLLKLIPREAAEHLRFVDEVSLGFIAFYAGSELYLKELRSRFKSIRWVTAGLVVSTFIFGSLAFFLLSDILPLMAGMSMQGRIAVSILAGSILIARSPSSAIAVVTELRAKGPFTKTVLGVTVIMDVLVITIFAINLSIADALLTGLRVNFSFFVLLAAELVASVGAGVLLGKILQLILSLRIRRSIKTVMILLSGYSVFFLSEALRVYTHSNFQAEVMVEPLLICMIGGFIATNFSHYRNELLKILHDVGPPIYVVFFTLTGASLSLDILVKAWGVALVLFAVRMGAIFLGSLGGGVLAGDPVRRSRIAWMAYITQAGVGLGLAKEVAVAFPDWGPAFATIIISVIVLNQIVGPPLFKWAIHLVGESHPRADVHEPDGVRDAVIFGLEGQSLALARLLRSNDWEVSIISSDEKYIEETGEDPEIDINIIQTVSLEALRKLGVGQAETIVAMLSDEENYRICELAYEHFGTRTLVVRLNNRANARRFLELGVLIVDPNTAIVSLLDQFVRSPSAASLFLGMEADKDIIEFELRNPDLHGLAILELRLPLDIHILSVRRKGEMLMSVGYTRLKIGDWFTVIGSVPSLEQMMLRFGGNREQEVVHLVERVTPAELTSRSLESEVTDILRETRKTGKGRFDRLITESVVVDLDGVIGYEDFFRIVADKLADRLNTDKEVLFGKLVEREKENSTAFSPGFAIPHIIIDGEGTFVILLARCRGGIRFSELAPAVNAAFVLVGTRDERIYHLRALSIIAGFVQNSRFEKLWLRARDENALRDVILHQRNH